MDTRVADYSIGFVVWAFSLFVLGIALANTQTHLPTTASTYSLSIFR